MVQSDGDEHVMRIVEGDRDREFNSELPAGSYEAALDFVLQPIPGQAVAAKSQMFNKWLRAEVVEVQTNTVKVEYVDLKLRERVPITRLRQILNEHVQVQVNSVKFALFGIVDREDEGKKRFEAMTMIKDMELKAWIIQNGDVKQVILYALNDDRILMNNYMVTVETATELPILKSYVARLFFKYPVLRRPQQHLAPPVVANSVELVTLADNYSRFVDACELPAKVDRFTLVTGSSWSRVVIRRNSDGESRVVRLYAVTPVNQQYDKRINKFINAHLNNTPIFVPIASTSTGLPNNSEEVEMYVSVRGRYFELGQLISWRQTADQSL